MANEIVEPSSVVMQMNMDILCAVYKLEHNRCLTALCWRQA